MWWKVSLMESVINDELMITNKQQIRLKTADSHRGTQTSRLYNKPTGFRTQVTSCCWHRGPRSFPATSVGKLDFS